MPSSIHRTQKAAIAKGKTLLKKGKNVHFNKVVSQALKKNKPSGPKKTEYIVTWK